MSQSQQQKSKRSKYRSITAEVRQQIVERVCKNGETIKDVSSQLGLNISTCKAIVKVYQQQGRIGKKKKRNKVVNVVETFSFYSIDGGKLQQIGAMKIQQSKMSLNTSGSFNEAVTKKSEERAKQLLSEIVETKRTIDQVFAQQQIIQNIGNQPIFYPPFNNGGNFY